MATDAQIVEQLNRHLRANGYTCGRNYTSVGGTVRSISASLPGETEQTLRPKVERIVLDPAYRFKTRLNGSEVSGSDAADPKCGS